MRALNPILCFIVVAALSVYAIEARTQQGCPCNGDRDDHFTGEDSKLRWTFETRSVARHPTHPKYCFFENVLNKSAGDIIEVKWRVANYYRQMIPSQKPSPACVPWEGQIKPATTPGKLIHGLAGNYDTQVRQPTDGWGPPRTEEKKEGVIDQERQPSVLRAELQIYADEKSWAHLIIDSTVSPLDATKSALFYEIKNTGNLEVAVLANIPVVPSMVRDVSMVQKQYSLSAGNHQSFKTSIDGRFEVHSATIVIFDKGGDKILGVNSIGVYAPINGKPLRSDEDLWDKLLK